jgi:secreted PhoX family phosphatase
MNMRTLRRRAAAAAAASVGLVAFTAAAGAHAGGQHAAELPFRPITTNALSCSATGSILFAPTQDGKAVVPKILAQAGDPATLVNSTTATKVGAENDMIALSPDGKYLYTSSEAGVSDGITRVTLKGKNKGAKEILATVPGWSRVDGMNWYPYGGPDREGVLLGSEEFSAGGIWQTNPVTGATTRLDWLGNYSHEGVGIDRAGNLYLADESRTGAFYKAVPTDRTDLTKGGTLYFLVPTSVDASGWKAVVNPATAISEASTAGAVLFDRPEDIEANNGRIYFTVTEPFSDSGTRHGAAGQVVNRGGIYSVNAVGVPDLAVQSAAAVDHYLTPMIEVNDPKYVDAQQAKDQQGLQFPDNIAFDGAGNLWVHEDVPDAATFPANGVDVSKQIRDQQDELYVYVLSRKGDAIVANPDTSGPGVSGGYKAADMRNSAAAKPCENEFTGGVFASDGETLYINQQHFDNPTVVVKFD